MEYDDFIVGAGSFGGTKAALASEDQKRGVLLIEAGPDSRHHTDNSKQEVADLVQ